MTSDVTRKINEPTTATAGSARRVMDAKICTSSVFSDGLVMNGWTNS